MNAQLPAQQYTQFSAPDLPDRCKGVVHYISLGRASWVGHGFCVRGERFGSDATWLNMNFFLALRQDASDVSLCERLFWFSAVFVGQSPQSYEAALI